MATLVSGLTALCTSLNADGVKEIISTSLTDAQINAFLNIAYYMALPLTDELDDCGASAMHCEIVKMLAAHLITLRERMPRSESISEWSVTYMGQDGQGLESSLYGQQAIEMDCSGKLALLGLKRASVDVISYWELEGSRYLLNDGPSS